MSREKKVHNYIERVSTPQQEENWKQIQARVQSSEIPVNFTTDTEVDSNRGDVVTLSRRKKIVISFATFFLLAATVLLTCLLLLDNKSNTRYCTVEDYTSELSNLTIKEYAQLNNKYILYFDWYNITENSSNIVFELIESKEIISISETMMDMETGYSVTLSFTDNKTEIDFFAIYDTVCISDANINNVNVKWGVGTFRSYVKFEYQGYKYYLEVDDTLEQDFLLNYVEQLLA